ncbi:alpha/beta hydrolase [Novosphingobium sp.]|uniref:alpha/beta hydrolase n=1 Tax=Novosphingobium sp. TaxID=1874826 RepID=UPI0025D19DB0|nr:alpha/beta hydrolase [Novosphingobium sp.]
MRRIPIAGLVALALAGALDASASARPGDRIRAALAARMVRDDGPDQIAPGETLRYGADPAQSLSFWHARGVSGPAPLIVYVHGGGWSRGSKDNATGRWKVEHFPGEGYAFATIDYRLVPGATVEDEAADVAHALKALLDRAAALGIDRTRVVLMGHSAGAHLVALVGTDEWYLRAAGLSFGTLAGVIPIDGAAYDVPAQMADGPGIMQQTYRAAFGTDPVRQRALSPTLAARAHPFGSASVPGSAPHFLLLHVQRPDGVRQAEALETALQAAGAPVERAGFEGTGLKGHMTINRKLGDPDYLATGAVDRWLKRLFSR